MANINVYGTFNSMAEDQTVAKAAQIYDDNKLKNQQTINEELEEKIDNLEFSANNISYDLTQTPDLGGGDVQSAIEAEDAKVEQLSLDTMGEDESGEYWEDELHEVKGYSEISRGHRIGSYHGTSQSGYHIFIFPSSEGDVWKVEKAAGAGQWEGFWKGGTNYAAITAANHLQSWSQAAGTFTAPAGTTLFAVVTNTANEFLTTAWKKTTRPAKTPADIQRQLIEGWTLSSIVNSGVIGSKLSYFVAAAGTYAKRIEVRKGQVLLLDLSHSSNYPLTFTDYDRVITELHPSPVYGAFEAPNDGYAYLLNGGDIPDNCYIYIMGYGGHAKDMVRIMEDTGEVADQKIDDEKVEFIKERFPSETSIPKLYGRSNFNGATFSNTDDNTTWTITAQSNTNYRCFWTKELVPKGTHIIFKMVSTANTNYWRRLGYSTDVRPQDYYASHSNTIVGYKVEHKIGATNNKNATYTIEFTMPEDGWLVWTNIRDTDTGETQLHAQLYDPTLLVDLYTEYYKKGVADGSGMASIVGLGYNIWDYVSGAVDMAGFEYGCGLYRNSQALSGACADKYNNNTKLVYFPKFDMNGVTTWGSIFAGCTTLQIVPDLNVASPTGSYQFSGCTNLLEVGDIGSESGTISVYYMFQNCTHLRRVGNIHAKISGSTGRMFYITSALTHIESINFSLQTTVYTNTGNQTFTSTSNLRYVVLKYLGTPSNCTALNLSLITNWGVATTAEPNARQSLIDTLITYSFDRVTAGYSACTITLSANTKALLTEEEIEQITAKGYTIA